MAVALGAGLWLAPEALAQAGNDMGQNLGDLLRRYAGQIYGGVIAIVALIFLINRRYTELGLFFLAAVLVAWLVFSPDQVADTARGIGDEILP
ncbi:MAG: hypothetical protein ACRDN8_08080 [Thermoleophilaceae bacterium]